MYLCICMLYWTNSLKHTRHLSSNFLYLLPVSCCLECIAFSKMNMSWYRYTVLTVFTNTFQRSVCTAEVYFRGSSLLRRPVWSCKHKCVVSAVRWPLSALDGQALAGDGTMSVVMGNGGFWGVQGLAHQCDWWGMLCLTKAVFTDCKTKCPRLSVWMCTHWSQGRWCQCSLACLKKNVIMLTGKYFCCIKPQWGNHTKVMGHKCS